MASFFLAFGLIELRDNITSYSELFGHQCNGFPLLHNLFIHSFTLSYIPSSLHLSLNLIQTLPPLEGTIGSATVLVQIASSNTSLANASPSVHSHLYRVSSQVQN